MSGWLERKINRLVGEVLTARGEPDPEPHYTGTACGRCGGAMVYRPRQYERAFGYGPDTLIEAHNRCVVCKATADLPVAVMRERRKKERK